MKERTRHYDRAGLMSICALMIAPPLLKVFLAPASALWVDRLRSWIDRTSAQSTAKLVLESELNSLARSDAHGDTLRRRC
jgi:hypothetical protein